MIGLEITNRQRGVAFDLSFLTDMVQAAHPFCLAALRADSAPLAGLTGIEASILSDRMIAQVHREFFDDPTPTDVITFHHGEILLGAGVVADNAERFGRSVDEEAALCLIHGMLHLAGWDDLTPADAGKMAARQERIFKKFLPRRQSRLTNTGAAEGTPGRARPPGGPRFAPPRVNPPIGGCVIF